MKCKNIFGCHHYYLKEVRMLHEGQLHISIPIRIFFMTTIMMHHIFPKTHLVILLMIYKMGNKYRHLQKLPDFGG